MKLIYKVKNGFHESVPWPGPQYPISLGRLPKLVVQQRGSPAKFSIFYPSNDILTDLALNSTGKMLDVSE